MAINVWSYLKEYEAEKEEIYSAIEKVLSSGMLILGESVGKFEEAFSAWCGTRFGIGVNSGTDALFLALKALGIGNDDQVITVANTAVPTVSAIVSTGAVPVFADIDPDTYLMDTDSIEDLINDKTACILPVHLFGQCVNMEALCSIARQRGIPILEDCAQSHGAQHNGKPAGSFGDASAFSFYPTKILGGFGDGGMVCTSSELLRDKLRRLRFYGMEMTYYSVEHGFNSRLDELHAEILFRKLARLDKYIARRRQIADRYNKLLQGTSLILPKEAENNKHAYYLYVCRHRRRDEIIEALRKYDIFVNISYRWPIHIMKGYEYLGYKTGDLPETEKACDEIFSLPMYPSLGDDEQERVCQALHNILDSGE